MNIKSGKAWSQCKDLNSVAIQPQMYPQNTLHVYLASLPII